MPAHLALLSKPQQVSRPRRLADLDLWLKIAVPIFLLASLFIALDSGFFQGYLRLFQRNTYTSLLSALGAVYALAFLTMQAIRTVLWWRYRPYPLPEGPSPRVTVLIPAYNEGAMVEKALYSVAAADYPKDRLEIICIDDGSRDDTWNYIQRARQHYPHLIQAIRFPKNRGKREALYAGFLRGRGEYFVTVDSDSVIEPDTLKQILAPLRQSPKIGAVAGNVKVYNRTANLLTRMVWVRFVLSFDFLRASQSMYGFVFCTPGALSAYRREAIMPILDAWRQQTFLGLRCTIGEDRAFTNLVLRQGYDTVYQRSAVVYTTVPEHYRGLSRMFLRWDRSNFRESLVQLSYMFTRYRPRNRLLPILDFVVRELEFPVTAIFLPLMLASFLCCPILIVKFVSGMALVSFFLSSYYLRQERDADFVYGVIYSFYALLFLRWVRPYAFFTLRDGRWLTR
ncbi:MAG: glycosyltransferase family 2 protein [Syntrophobacterales bacterium]|jgi:hyaluronan synthase|nr:glycosyltransferase family 2 protein [Syntrophobacterales bacterium]